jgi:hypothetical protein
VFRSISFVAARVGEFCVGVGSTLTGGFGFFTAKKSRMDFSGGGFRFAGALADGALVRDAMAK